MKFNSVTAADLEHLSQLTRSHKIREPQVVIEYQDYPEIVKTNLWPAAIDPQQIVSNENEKIKRAMCILGEFPNIEKLLDFGCGDGSVANYKPGAVGYDIVGEWTNPNITTDWEAVKSHGPYDAILLYDVVDHMRSWSDLHRIKDVATDDCTIYVRCHPFMGIHGGHTYEKLNKAYAHLMLTPGDLPAYTDVFTLKIPNYLETYDRLWEALGWKTITRKVYTCKIPQTLNEDEYFCNLIKGKYWPTEAVDVRNKISVAFVDYWLGV